MDKDFASFARGGDTKELRGDAPTELVVVLDALALAKDMTRNAYVVDVLRKHVSREIHRHIVEANALRGNPLLAETLRNRPDSGGAA